MNNVTKFTAASLVALATAFVATGAFADRGNGMGGQMGDMRNGGFAAFDFAGADADKDGKVSKEELDAYRAAQAKALDTDGDGLISAEELAAMHMKGAQQRATDMATRMIERRDSDGDGKLSAAEMSVRPVPAAMFDRLDTDKDGALSQAELDAAKEKMMNRAEGRGDGKGKMRRGGHSHGDNG